MIDLRKKIATQYFSGELQRADFLRGLNIDITNRAVYAQSL